MTLLTLQLHAGIDGYNRHEWFLGAILKPPYLYIPEVLPGHLAFVERNYLPKMRELMPDLELRAMAAAPKAVSKGQPLYNTKLFKRPPYGTKDLLD